MRAQHVRCTALRARRLSWRHLTIGRAAAAPPPVELSIGAWRRDATWTRAVETIRRLEAGLPLGTALREAVGVALGEKLKEAAGEPLCVAFKEATGVALGE